MPLLPPVRWQPNRLPQKDASQKLSARGDPFVSIGMARC